MDGWSERCFVEYLWLVVVDDAWVMLGYDWALLNLCNEEERERLL